MKAMLLKSVMCFMLIFMCALNTNVIAQNNFVTNDVMNGEQIASKVIYRNDGMLYRHMKHDFKYDNQNRVVEKETFRWNSLKKEWIPYYKINLAYTSGQLVVEYAKWQKKDKKYSGPTERNIYELDGFNIPVAYQEHKWDNKNAEWKIADIVTIQNPPVLYVQSK